MLMIILRNPEERMYWTDNIMLLTPYFKGVMSHRRFTKIQQNLHFNNKNLKEDDKYYKDRKIYPILKRLAKNFKKVYTPDRDIFVDESLLGFKGRLNIIQYFPMKTN